MQAHKTALKASDFIKYGRLTLPRHAGACIMHTRAKTQGSEQDNRNNHPIVVADGRMVGVHNGMLWNDDDIFRYLGADLRIGQVDSEAIFALLAHSNTSVEESLSTLEGSVACAWMTTDEGPDTLHLARVSQSPLIVGQTEGGSLLFASTEWTLKDAAERLGLELTHVRHTPEGQHLIVKEGKVEDVRTFDPAHSYYSGFSWGYEKVPGTQHTYRKTGASSGVVTHLPPVNKAENTVLADNLKQEREVVNVYPTALPVPERAKAEELPCYSHIVQVRLFNVLEEVGTADYYEVYQRREEAIEDWLENAHTATVEDTEKLYNKLCVFLRPGDYVSTNFGGRDVTAQVVALPQSFPNGSYTLRARVPNSARKSAGAEEVVVFQRYSYEMEQLHPYEFTQTGRDREFAALD